MCSVIIEPEWNQPQSCLEVQNTVYKAKTTVWISEQLLRKTWDVIGAMVPSSIELLWPLATSTMFLVLQFQDILWNLMKFESGPICAFYVAHRHAWDVPMFRPGTSNRFSERTSRSWLLLLFLDLRTFLNQVQSVDWQQIAKSQKICWTWINTGLSNCKTKTVYLWPFFLRWGAARKMIKKVTARWIGLVLSCAIHPSIRHHLNAFKEPQDAHSSAMLKPVAELGMKLWKRSRSIKPYQASMLSHIKPKLSIMGNSPASFNSLNKYCKAC